MDSNGKTYSNVNIFHTSSIIVGCLWKALNIVHKISISDQFRLEYFQKFRHLWGWINSHGEYLSKNRKKENKASMEWKPFEVAYWILCIHSKTLHFFFSFLMMKTKKTSFRQWHFKTHQIEFSYMKRIAI